MILGPGRGLPAKGDKKGGNMKALDPAAAISALAVAALLAVAPAANGATFAVNSTADAVDVNPGDGVCATAAGTCTLRAAIQEANALAGADTIVLPAGTFTITIPGQGED